MKPAKRNEWSLNAATLISNFGDGMHTLAIGQILYDRTGRVTAFGLIIALNYLIGIVCQVYAGHLADRFSRSRMVIYTNYLRGVLVLGLALMVAFGWPIYAIVGLSLVIKIGTQIYRPAYQAMISEAIPREDLSAFNSHNVACMQGGQLLGMAAFGAIFLFGPASVFVADAMTFLAAGLIVRWLALETVANVVRRSQASIVSSWTEAYHYVREQKGLTLHLIFSASIFLIYPIEEISIVPVNTLRFGGDKMWLSIMSATFSIGCVLSMLIMRVWDEEERAYLWMIAQAVFVGLLAISESSRPLVLISYFGMGLSSTMATIQLLNRLMKRSPHAFQGRIAALRYLYISVMIAVLVPILTSMFARSLNAGLGFGFLILAGFACVATVASLRGSFLGDASEIRTPCERESS